MVDVVMPDVDFSPAVSCTHCGAVISTLKNGLYCPNYSREPRWWNNIRHCRVCGVNYVNQSVEQLEHDHNQRGS